MSEGGNSILGRLRLAGFTGAAGGLAAFLLALIILLVVAKPSRREPPGVVLRESPATVTAEIAELKKDPSAGSGAAGALPRGARVTVLEDRGRWLKVRAEKGLVGFLPAETVETDAERQTRERRSAKILSFPPVFGVVAAETDILLAPYPSAARAGRLRPGTPVPIHAVDHAYYAFRRPEGGIAFVNSADVDLVPPDPSRPAIVPAGGRALKDVAVKNLQPSEAPTPQAGESAEGAGTPGPPPVSAGEPSGEPLEQAVLVSKVDPVYPDAARRSGVEGTVVLDATIGADGRVTDVAVVRGLPLGVSEAAADAVRRWQYRPARGRFGPVPSHKTIRIVFELHEGSNPERL